MFEVHHNGELSSSSEFCIGDDVTFTCRIGNIQTYVWLVSGLVMGNDRVAVVGLGATTREK